MIHRVDVGRDGRFENRESLEVGLEGEEEFWEIMQVKVRVRLLCVGDVDLMWRWYVEARGD